MRNPLLLTLSLVSLPLVSTSFAAPSSADLAREYDQVKRIAQRDPKVRAAYEAADRKLADKIVEIDPALKGYTPGKPFTPEPAPKPATAAKPAPAPAAKPQPKPAAPAPKKGGHYQRAHVVEKGDTLGSIAAKYKVSTADLRAANEIRDERKLIVGQVLAIPNGGGKPAPAKPAAAKPAAAKPTKAKAPAKKGETGWWDQVKGAF